MFETKYHMKSLKIIKFLRYDYPTSIFEEINSRKELRLKSLAKAMEISEDVYLMMSSYQY